MYNNVSKQFATTIRSPSRTFNLRLKINGKWIDAGFKKMSYETASTSDEGIQIGSAVAAKIELTVKRINELFENTEIPIEIGLKLPSGKYEYIPLGFFTAEHPTLDQATTTFTAYDRMMKTAGVYVSELTYPASAESVLKEISTGCGVPCNVSGLNGITIDTAPVGYTYREVIGYIASLAGGFACVDRTGTIVIKWYEDNDYTINESRIMTFEKNESDYHLDYLTCNVDSNTSFTAGSGTLGITFDNPLMTEEKLNSVYKKVRGFAYRGASLKTLGDIRLDPWDIVTAEESGETYNIPVMNITQEYDGGLAMTITAYGKTETETETDYKGPSTKLAERTYAEMMLTKELVSKKVDAEWVKANTVTAETIVSVNNELQYIKNNYLKSNEADIKFATIEEEKVIKSDIEHLHAGYEKVGILDGDVADIKTLMFGSASGGSLTTEFSNAIVSLIGDAQIKSAMIESIDAKKITALDINTTSMKVHSESGLSYWQDNTIVISDGTRTRVQLGKDASADYNMYIWDKAGNLMFDALGLTAKGIQREIIRNDMVSQDAGISAGKLDIGSLFEVINKDESHTLKSSKIYVDADNQTLDVSFKTITTKTNTAVEAANKATESADNALSTANSADAKAQSVVNRADSGEFKGDKGDQGIQGPKGDTGATGKGVKSTAVTYQASSNSITAPTGTWNTSIPSVGAGHYLWTRTIITYTDNTTSTLYSVSRNGTNGTNGTNGQNGKSIGSVVNYYLATNTNTGVTASTSGWTTTVQSVSVSKKYLWNYEIVKYTDGTIASTTAPCIIGSYGDTGEAGKNATYITVYGSNYDAMAAGDTTASYISVNGTKYGFSPGRGHTLAIVNPSNGSVESIKSYDTYGTATALDTVLPSVATGKIICLFSYDATSLTQTARDALISCGSGMTNTWGSSRVTHVFIGMKGIARGSAYEAIASGNSGTRTITAYYTSSGIVLNGAIGNTGATGATGATGNGIKSIAEHYAVSASNASAPTSWSNTVPTMTVTNRYLWNYETITYTNNSVVDTAKRVIGVYGNTGETGIGVKQITPQYYLSTSNATQNGGSWSNTRPAWISGRYYWTRDYILWTDGSATYSTPQLATDLNNLYSSLKTVTDTVSYQGTQLSTVQGQISSKVWQQDITTAVTSLEIGGRNLLQGLKWCVKDNPAKTGNATDAYVYIGGKAHLENGKTYTLQAVSDSVWATGHGGQTGKATIWIHGLGDGFHRVFCGDGKTSGRYTWTFVHTSATQNCEIRINGYSKVTSFWNFKIESGNKATDWTPAPEDIDDSIVSVEGKVTTVSNQYTSLNQALTSLAATVNSNTTAISKKADGSTVTSLQNNITAIQADLGGFKTTVSNTYTTKTEFDELKIGGRNLAQKTNQGISGWRWTMQTGGVTATEVVESDIRTCKLTRDNVVQTGWSVIQYADIGRSKLETNTTYTISFDVKGSIDVSEWVVQLLHPDGTNPLGGGQIYINRASKANVWSKIVCVIKTYETFPTRTGQCLYLSNMPSGPGRWYQFRNVKIEKGNKATDWTPAPEDYSTTIEMNSAINQSANNVTAEVKGYTDTKLGSYATKASLSAYIAKSDTGTLKSCIEAIADDINLTAGGTINISGNKSVNISGNKFSLDSSGTKISSAGYLQTTNAKLGEWDVDKKAIYCKTADGVYTAYLQNPDYVVGETRENAWVYSVQKNGYRTFSVTSEGELYAKNILPVKSYEELNYRWTSYGNSTEEFSASWHFKGTGLLLVSCAIWTDETSDYGTTSCAIYINNVCVVANRHRYGESENSVELDAGCSFAYWFTDADITLQIIGGSTKDGLKTFTRTVQALFGLKEV